MIEIAGGIAAILGAVGAVTAFLRDWKAAPKLVLTSIAIVGVALAVVPTATDQSGSGSSGSYPAPSSPATTSSPPTSSPQSGAGSAASQTPQPPSQTIPADPTDSEEYQDCLRNGGYAGADCEVLRDEVSGEQARSIYRDCRQSGYDVAYCLQLTQE